jgi:hypothetical protein
MNMTNIVLQSASVMVAATFASSSDANSFARDLFGILRARKTPHVLAAIS